MWFRMQMVPEHMETCVQAVEQNAATGNPLSPNVTQRETQHVAALELYREFHWNPLEEDEWHWTTSHVLCEMLQAGQAGALWCNIT